MSFEVLVICRLQNLGACDADKAIQAWGLSLGSSHIDHNPTANLALQQFACDFYDLWQSDFARHVLEFGEFKVSNQPAPGLMA